MNKQDKILIASGAVLALFFIVSLGYSRSIKKQLSSLTEAVNKKSASVEVKPAATKEKEPDAKETE